ncbi:MAG: ribbon-helix-helix domain-containing protein [Candidatus Nezhaarchaeales archaeon]
MFQARLPEVLVRELDELVERGLYRNRTEALEDAIRHLIERMKGLSDTGFLVSKYLNGKLPPRDVDPLKMVYGDDALEKDH